MTTQPLYCSLYSLTRQECLRLRLTDTYSLHRIVYDLFERTRAADEQTHSGILFADNGVREGWRRLLILSDRPPREAACGLLETREVPAAYLEQPVYRFAITINPVRRNNRTRKLEPVRGRQGVTDWFLGRAPDWGFTVDAETFQVGEIMVDTFTKGENGKTTVTLSKASLTGTLRVTDRERFAQSVRNGIGRGRAFGCGLLQVTPCAG